MQLPPMTAPLLNSRNMSVSERGESFGAQLDVATGVGVGEHRSAAPDYRPSAAAIAPAVPAARVEGKPWDDLLNLNPPPSPPPEKGDETIDEIYIYSDENNGNDTEEILVLDEIGVCEDVTASDANVEQDGGHNFQVQVEREAPDTLPASRENVTPGLGLSTELDDDILSIMCVDNEEDEDNLLGNDSSKKRDWSFELRFSSKRKQDTAISTAEPVAFKKGRLLVTPDGNTRSRSRSMPSRLGKKSFQSDRESHQKPCFNFTKYGRCYRPSCQFLHPNRTWNDGAFPNRRIRAEYSDNNITGYHAYQVTELQQKVQEQHMQLQQQKVQLQVLREHLQQMEHGRKTYDSNQAKQVQESLHLIRRQQEQLNHTKLMYEQLGHASCKIDKHVSLLQARVRCLEASEYSHHNILAHYQFIADFQHSQLRRCTQASGCTDGSGPASEQPSHDNGPCLPLLPVPDLRHLPPLKKPDCHPPRPNSADGHYPGRASCASRDVPLAHRCHEVDDGRHGWCLGTATLTPPMMRSSTGLADHVLHRAQSNCPRVVRIVPLQQPCSGPLFVDYQHEHASVQPQ